MTKLKLMDVLNSVYEAEYIKSGISKKSFINVCLRNLDFRGENEHLRNELLDDVVPHEERKQVLTGDEVITGDYLLFDSCGHDGSRRIWGYNTIKELEQSIVGPGGYINRFTSSNVPFIKGELKKFRIVAIVDNGDKHIHVKYENDDMFFRNFSRKDLKVEWL